MSRPACLAELAAHLLARRAALPAPRPWRVAVDGLDAAGKTTLADELAACLAASGCPVLRASLDGFQRPRAARYRRGAESPEGYYADAFDYPALVARLLAPLSPGGDRRCVTAVFDYRADAPVALAPVLAPPDAILLVDGVFLLRPELARYWDYRIFVDVAFETALARALERDGHLGAVETITARYHRRYFPAQQHYLAAVQPRRQAEAVLLNDHPATPHLTFQD
jgi:uridine kinase